MNDTKRTIGRPFAKGHDLRRRVFTPEEQREHFYLLLATLAERDPGKPLRNVLRNLKARCARA